MMVSNTNRISQNSRIIPVSKKDVYNAFTDKTALEFWLAPDNMMGKIHSFNLKVGGGYTMSLFYTDKETKGKISGNEDRSTIKFVELNPYESIVQTVNFQSDRNEFAEQMTMEILLKENNSA